MKAKCLSCGKIKKIEAKGLCKNCYSKKWYEKNKEQERKRSLDYYHSQKGKKVRTKYQKENKEKINQKIKEIKQNNRNKYNKISRDYYAKNKETIYENKKKYIKNNRLKVNARNLAKKIKIPKGQICKDCKKALATERHHEDYKKPLKVEFLCKKCHTKRDKK